MSPEDEVGHLRSILEKLDPKARDTLRRVLIRDQADRDAIASQLVRYRDGRRDDWADIIDMLKMHPDSRRTVVQIRSFGCDAVPSLLGSVPGAGAPARRAA